MQRKKILFVLPIMALLAAGCGKTAATPPAAPSSAVPQQTSQATAPTATPPSDQLATVNEPLPTTPYTANGDNFSVNFPGTPQKTTSTFPSPSAGVIPVTEYRQQYSSGSQYAYYTIYVYHYPASYKFGADYLNGALQTFNKVVGMVFPGTAITSQQPTQFLGKPALTALITVPLPSGSSTVNTPDYALLTVNNQNLYIISTYGMTQDNYNAFINSFKFNQ